MKATHSLEVHIVENDFLVQSPEVARQLGISTETLRKWRREGKGPDHPVRVNATNISYWNGEVQRFKRSLGDQHSRQIRLVKPPKKG